MAQHIYLVGVGAIAYHDAETARALPNSEHVTVSAAGRQNNLIEQAHRPTRDQERQQRGFRTAPGT